MEPITLEAFDGQERSPMQARRQREARADGLSVEQHRAGSADTLAAAVLRAGQRKPVAQKIEHRPVRRRLGPARPAIEGQLEGQAHARQPPSRSLASTRSGVIGSSVTRRPRARDTAFITAAGVGVMAGSPIPLAPKGPRPFPDSIMTVSTAGESSVV